METVIGQALLRRDPAETRRRNLIGPRDMPYTTGYTRLGGTRPVVYDGSDYPRQLRDRAATALEVTADDLSLGPFGAEVRGVPGRRIGLAELLDGGGPLTAEATFRSSGAYTAIEDALRTLGIDAALGPLPVTPARLFNLLSVA